MANNRDIQELERENKDLRKRIAYLENEVAYLMALHDILTKEDSENLAKKDNAKQSLKLSKKEKSG